MAGGFMVLGREDEPQFKHMRETNAIRSAIFDVIKDKKYVHSVEVNCLNYLKGKYVIEVKVKMNEPEYVMDILTKGGISIEEAIRSVTDISMPVELKIEQI
jgi:hypothetical protein